MQDLIDIALEGGCLDMEDLDRPPVRLVACPDRADRCSGYCRSKPSVWHQPAVKSRCKVRRGGSLTVLMLDLTRCPYSHRNAAKTWPHCSTRILILVTQQLLDSTSKPSAARRLMSSEVFGENAQETVGPPVA